MSTIYWGVDSQTPSNFKVGTTTFFDRVVEKMTPADVAKAGGKRVPQFWGRYLNLHNALTAHEVSFLLGRDVKIMLFYTFSGPSDVTGKEKDGLAAGRSAIAKAKTVLPADQWNGTWIYADIEGWWNPSSSWMVGWMKAMLDSEFGGIGGFYCNNTYPPAFNNPLDKALPQIATYMGWSLGTVQDMCLLFVQNPTGHSGVNVSDQTLNFNPAVAKANPNGSVVWQAAMNKYVINSSVGGVDIDTANERGLQSMAWP